MSKRKVKKSPIQTAFGRAIRELRYQQNLTQENLSELSGLHPNYIGSVERGERNVTLENICKLAKGLNSHPADLFNRSRYPFCLPDK